MKTVSLELAKQLKEKGYPQDITFSGSYFYQGTINEIEKEEGYVLLSHRELLGFKGAIKILAPTADEILERLPARITNPSTRNMDRLTFFIRGHAGDDSKQDVRDGFTLEYWTNYNQPLVRIRDDTLADAAAKMWLYLKENDLLDRI